MNIQVISHLPISQNILLGKIATTLRKNEEYGVHMDLLVKDMGYLETLAIETNLHFKKLTPMFWCLQPVLNTAHDRIIKINPPSGSPKVNETIVRSPNAIQNFIAEIGIDLEKTFSENAIRIIKLTELWLNKPKLKTINDFGATAEERRWLELLFETGYFEAEKNGEVIQEHKT